MKINHETLTNLALRLSKALLLMKLSVFIVLLFSFQSFAFHGFTQNKISLNVQHENLEEVLKKIEAQGKYNFVYKSGILPKEHYVNLDVNEASLQYVLTKLLTSTDLSFKELKNGMVVIYPKSESAKSIVVTGRVTDETGKPIAGVSVMEKGTPNGTTTNNEGIFSMEISGLNVVLSFSFVGYQSQEVKVTTADTRLDVKMEPVNEEMKSVVVVAYGTTRKHDLVGSVAQIGASEIKDMPTGTFAEKLQGKLSGVQLSQTTGRPGQGMSFRIRGAASVGTNNYPLVVVDGIPISGSPDAINNINPDEIESVSVQKDASSTSLYGSRAANGVIIITTKRGKTGKARIDVNVYNGVATPMYERSLKVMNGTQLATYMKEFYEDKIKYEGTGTVPAAYQNPEQYGEGTNWYRIIQRNAPVENYSVSVSSGNDKASLFFVGGFFNQQGVLKNSGYKRISLRTNFDYKLNDNIKFGVNLAPSLQLEHNNRQGTGFNVDGQRSILASTYMMPSMASPYNPDGSLAIAVNPSPATGFPSLASWPNPLRQLLEINDDANRLRLIGNVFTTIKLLRDVEFRSSFNFDISGFSRKKFVPSTARGGFNLPPLENPAMGSGRTAYAESNSNNNYYWNQENVLQYNKTINKIHNIHVLAGFSAQRFTDYRNNMTGEDFPDNSIQYLSLNNRYTTANSTSTAWTMASFFGSFDYVLKDRYLLKAAIRRDGSSRFGFNNRWGTFPSVGAGWVVSEEPFFGNKKIVNYLKIRSTYGLTGNNEIGDYTAIPLIDNSNYVFGSALAPGKVQTSLGNSLLSWEKNRQWDAGADISLFKDRLQITYDYYNKITDGLLYPVQVPVSSGYSSIYDNIGTIKSWGHEISVASRNLVGKFKWRTDFNISFNRSKVTKLGVTNSAIAGSAGTAITEFSDWKTEVGKPLGLFYGYVFDGVFKNQAEFNAGPRYYNSSGVLQSVVGSVRMKDLNGDGKITADGDRTFIGDPNPKFIFGLTNSFSYKNLDLAIVLSGTYGNKIKNSMYESLYNMDGLFNGVPELLGKWRSEDDPGNGRVQRSQVAGQSTLLSRADNSYFIKNGSHITVNNITLGYTVEKSRLFRSLRVYATVQNAYIFTKYDGNPEVSSNGLNGISQGEDIGAYPLARTYTIGVNLGL